MCNGENNTPDLRNRFIVGAGSSYSVGNTGGSDSVTITTEQLPSHSHGHSLSVSASGLKCESGGSHTHGVSMGSSAPAYLGVASSNGGTTTYRNFSGGEHTHDITGNITLEGSISNTGSGQSHENRPPYYALCFIMKE